MIWVDNIWAHSIYDDVWHDLRLLHKYIHMYTMYMTYVYETKNWSFDAFKKKCCFIMQTKPSWWSTLHQTLYIIFILVSICWNSCRYIYKYMNIYIYNYIYKIENIEILKYVFDSKKYVAVNKNNPTTLIWRETIIHIWRQFSNWIKGTVHWLRGWLWA